MLRKRAWDFVRDDFAMIRDNATLADAMRAMQEVMQRQPDCDLILAVDEDGRFTGAVSVQGILRFMNRSLVRDLPSGEYQAPDFEQEFEQNCKVCAAMPVSRVADPDVPTASPKAPLGEVLAKCVRQDKNHVVVLESGRILGVILASDLFQALGKHVHAPGN